MSRDKLVAFSSCRSIEIPRLREAGKPKQHPRLEYLFGEFEDQQRTATRREGVVGMAQNTFLDTVFASHFEQEGSFSSS